MNTKNYKQNKIILFTFSTHITDFIPEGQLDEKGKRKKQAKERQVPKANKFKNTPGDEKEFVKAIAPTPPIWDFFYPNPGVTLMLEGRTKMEPRMSNLSMTSLSDPKVRLTRAEYINLTRSGNLSRENLAKTGAFVGQSDLGVLHQVNESEENDSAAFGHSIDGPLHSALSNKNKKKKKLKAQASIKIGNSLYSNLLTNAISETEDAMLQQQRLAIQEVERQQKQAEKKKKEELLKRSPVDEFNMGIINARDWGKSSFGTGFTPGSEKPIKPSEKQIKVAVGPLDKKPRERTAHQEKVKSDGLKFLPPPMVGKTIGHGISPASNILDSAFDH